LGSGIKIKKSKRQYITIQCKMKSAKGRVQSEYLPWSNFKHRPSDSRQILPPIILDDLLEEIPKGGNLVGLSPKKWLETT